MIAGVQLRRVAQALFFASAMLAASGARADADSDERGRALFEQGVEAARAEHWPQALEAFTQAYGVLPRPAILMNVAGAQVQTGRVVAGVASYKKVLASGTLSDEQRGAAVQALAAAEAKLAHVRVVVTAPTSSDQIFLDDERVGAGVELPVDPGAHHVRLLRSSADPQDQAFSVVAGERRDLELSAPPAKPATSLPTTAIVVAGVSVVAFGTSAFLGLTGLSDLSDLRDGCGVASRCAPSDVDAANTKLLASDIALGVGIVTAAVAGYLWFSHGRRPDPAARAALPFGVRW